MPPIAPILSVLSKVPLWAWALAAVVAWGGWHRYRAIDARADFQRAQVQAQAEHAEQLAQDAAETKRRTKAIMETSDAATIRSQNDRAAADAARGAADRLRQRLAAVQADTRAVDTSTATGCQATIAAADLHSQVLERVVSAARHLGEYADAAATAGQACERSYDTLKDEK